MRFKGMDLNLLVAFEALMETRNTARAGEKIGLSQPATSAALSRLRANFRDELLVVKGRRMFPTPLAETLLPRVRACLRSAESVISTSSQFDPARAERLFRIVASDYVSAALLSPLLRSLETSAPGVMLDLMPPESHSADLLRRGAVDLMITPSEYGSSGLPTEPLYEDNFVVAGCLDHPLFASQFTMEDIFTYGHIAVSLGETGSTTVGDRQLNLLGHARKVDIIAHSFTVVPWMLVGTQRLAIMHERLAHIAASHFSITYRPLPQAIEPLRQIIQYHETRASDPGLRWLIDLIRAEVKSPI